MKPKTIPLRMIDPPQRPLRTSIDGAYIEELSKSIREIGLIERIVVKPIDNGRYEVVAGHCRYLAMQLAQIEDARCDVTTDTMAQSAQMLAENTKRRELSPADECMFLAELYSKLGDVDKVAEAVSETDDYVSQRISLFVDGDDRVFEALRAGTIVFGQAVVLNKCEDDDQRILFLTSATSSGATIRQLRQWVMDANERTRMAQAEAATAATRGEAPAAPAAAPPAGPSYVHQADPREFSNKKDVRACKLCSEEMEEWKMFLIRVCEPCSNGILQPMLEQLHARHSSG